MGAFKVIINKLFKKNIDIIFMKNIKNHQKNIIVLSFFHKICLKIVHKLILLEQLLFSYENNVILLTTFYLSHFFFI